MYTLLLHSFLTVLMIIFVVVAIKKRKNNKILILQFIVAGIMIFVFGRYFLDSIFLCGSYTKLYDVPSRIGHISEVHLKKDGIPSELIFEGEQYEVDKDTVSGRNFKINNTYKITYTPITKTILSISDN